ncbi:50S ribosomal protein L3 [Candidatus Azambacteria bacterium]|nr:50S ribosomal protein L3 [Candidatus Azambacteria bacterium]
MAKDKFILGNKVGMTQAYDAQGSAVPITLVEVKPCIVTFVRTKEKDGYDAVQIGCGARKRTNKPETGHLRGHAPFAVLKEFRVKGASDKKVGDSIDVSIFSEGDEVEVSGVTKAKGFQGVVKRHNFGGGPASHGQKHSLREPGSIGATWPQRVIKGTRMAGRMGGDRRTVEGLTVMKVDKENNLIAIKGAIPGKNGALMEIKA